MRPSVDRSAKPVLFDTLSVLLPTVEQTWLLRACLHTGEAGRRAWQLWQERVGNPKKALAEDRQGIKGLLPLLYHALQSNGVVVDRDLLPYLRTAHFREELRSQTYRHIVQDVLTRLATAKIPLIVLDGAALADTVYGDWALRHCHALDVLVGEEDLSRATAVLTASGFSLLGGGLDAKARDIEFEHTSGLPIHLHCDLFRIPYYQAPVMDMWERSLKREIVGVPVRILAPADMLLRACGHASCSGSRDTLSWVCDAWSIIERCVDLDWDMFVDGTLRSSLALPLLVMLHYLANELDAPIPASVLHRLVVASAEAPVAAYEAALSGARAGTQGTLRNLLKQCGDWRAQAVVLKWMLLPSPSCLRWKYAIPSPWLLPLFYVYRPLKYVTRRMSHVFTQNSGR